MSMYNDIYILRKNQLNIVCCMGFHFFLMKGGFLQLPLHLFFDLYPNVLCAMLTVIPYNTVVQLTHMNAIRLFEVKHMRLYNNRHIYCHIIIMLHQV